MAGTDFETAGEAGEYVLGTLDPAERIAFEARLMRDAALRTEVEAWQKRLAPLDSQTTGAKPPEPVFDKILARIGAPAPSNVFQLQRQIRTWRNVAAGLATIAAGLLIFVLARPPEPAAPKGVYVAVLQGSDRTTGFVAAVDLRSKIIAVRSITARPQGGHSYELWALGAGRTGPQPIGLIEVSTRLSANTVSHESLGDTTLAVSLEPAGGSPTGSPTGPVLFTGKLVATE